MKKQPQEHAPRSQQKKRHPVLWIILSLLLIGFIFCAVNVIRALMQPTSVFAKNAATPIPESTVMAPAFPIATTTPDPDAPTADPANASPATPEPAVPVSAAPTIPEADMSNRLNVMLMGIDAKENGGTTSGSMPHTDVMMVIAINFDENTVDLITLPRDTLTTAPGHYGYYKLNGVFNVGLGGWKKPTGQANDLADGFLLTCRAAEQWLGGISIPYYYAVDFQAVINIVDAIGGIDYDVDQQFNAFNSNKTYHTGMQHLDGDAVMGYLRIRNGADGLDSSRTARQRKMMVAIFNKLKSEGTLSTIPDHRRQQRHLYQHHPDPDHLPGQLCHEAEHGQHSDPIHVWRDQRYRIRLAICVCGSAESDRSHPGGLRH